jgi:hypothetical protein
MWEFSGKCPSETQNAGNFPKKSVLKIIPGSLPS